MSSVETTIANRPASVARVTRLVDELAAAHRLSADVVADVNVALDDVLTNIITHGYADEGLHEIRVRMTVDDRLFEAEIEDDARPFNPLTVPPPDLSAPLRDRPVGGLGIYFARRLMSDVAYSRVCDRNRLVLRKYLTKRTEADPGEPA